MSCANRLGHPGPFIDMWFHTACGCDKMMPYIGHPPPIMKLHLKEKIVLWEDLTDPRATEIKTREFELTKVKRIRDESGMFLEAHYEEILPA